MKQQDDQSIEYIILLHGKLMNFLANSIEEDFTDKEKVPVGEVLAAFLLAAYQLNRDFGGKDFGEVVKKSIPLMEALDKEIQFFKKLEEDDAKKN